MPLFRIPCPSFQGNTHNQSSKQQMHAAPKATLQASKQHPLQAAKHKASQRILAASCYCLMEEKEHASCKLPVEDDEHINNKEDEHNNNKEEDDLDFVSNMFMEPKEQYNGAIEKELPINIKLDF
ncbi:hypothetical protein GUJ93_ZPchr0013g33788 [Zizania palustris]|uniref:Uncharacterized protein n=1 Tax=Zizania palustris TaxID=103762 RepID=A0A8J5X3K7_ZIZPA|nr:hypothetical protein GUJ93_ZPchr0013g33788 [Zizania palustris]